MEMEHIQTQEEIIHLQTQKEEITHLQTQKEAKKEAEQEARQEKAKQEEDEKLIKTFLDNFKLCYSRGLVNEDKICEVVKIIIDAVSGNIDNILDEHNPDILHKHLEGLVHILEGLIKINVFKPNELINKNISDLIVLVDKINIKFNELIKDMNIYEKLKYLSEKDIASMYYEEYNNIVSSLCSENLNIENFNLNMKNLKQVKEYLYESYSFSEEMTNTFRKILNKKLLKYEDNDLITVNILYLLDCIKK